MNLEEWIDQRGFMFKRINERPWGSYNLAASKDQGQVWAGFTDRSFGWGYSEKEAFRIMLLHASTINEYMRQLQTWLGDDLFNELNEVLNTLSESTSVSKYIHNEQK